MQNVRVEQKKKKETIESEEENQLDVNNVKNYKKMRKGSERKKCRCR